MKNKKPVTKVTRKFLLDLANDIYDPKTRRFMRLCDGKLQNGPDPTDETRPMHCGLGELYFAMTGAQPQDDDISENEVIDLAIELSPLNDERVRLLDRARAGIEALDLPESIKGDLIDQLDSHEDSEFETNEEAFREILDNIPNTNDDGCGDLCTYDVYRSRSSKVARQLREAAKLLPA